MSGFAVGLAMAGFLTLSPTGVANAQANRPQDPHSPVEYLRSLSEQERKEYDDLKADWDKRRQSDPNGFAKLQAKMVVQAQMILGRFGYGTKFTGALDSQTQEALRSYQANKGISISGGIDALLLLSDE